MVERRAGHPGPGGSVVTAAPALAPGGLDALADIDPSTVDWPLARRATLLVHQWARYEYGGPVEDLRQRLVVFPPMRHGSQRLVHHGLDVDGVPPDATHRWVDDFGNAHLEVHFRRVEQAVTFVTWSVVERVLGPGHRRPSPSGFTARLLRPTPLTRPNGALRAIARDLRGRGLTGEALARAACTEVHRRMAYAHDVTTVWTGAAAALAGGRGVCQDYAHIMIALCRTVGLPSRYVSGHLIGDAGSHAWVEVSVPHAGGARVLALDPTHDREAGPTYVTVAVGRDYADVPPFSGSYCAPHGNELRVGKRVAVLAVA